MKNATIIGPPHTLARELNYFQQMTPDILFLLLSKMSYRSLLRLRQVSKFFKNWVDGKEALWRFKFETDLPYILENKTLLSMAGKKSWGLNLRGRSSPHFIKALQITAEQYRLDHKTLVNAPRGLILDAMTGEMERLQNISHDDLKKPTLCNLSAAHGYLTELASANCPYDTNIALKAAKSLNLNVSVQKLSDVVIANFAIKQIVSAQDKNEIFGGAQLKSRNLITAFFLEKYEQQISNDERAFVTYKTLFSNPELFKLMMEKYFGSITWQNENIQSFIDLSAFLQDEERRIYFCGFSDEMFSKFLTILNDRNREDILKLTLYHLTKTNRVAVVKACLERYGATMPHKDILSAFPYTLQTPDMQMATLFLQNIPSLSQQPLKKLLFETAVDVLAILYFATTFIFISGLALATNFSLMNLLGASLSTTFVGWLCVKYVMNAATTQKIIPLMKLMQPSQEQGILSSFKNMTLQCTKVVLTLWSKGQEIYNATTPLVAKGWHTGILIYEKTLALFRSCSITKVKESTNQMISLKEGTQAPQILNLYRNTPTTKKPEEGRVNEKSRKVGSFRA